jgi:hypothetical protein
MLATIYGYDSPEELIATLTDIQHQLYVDPSSRAEFMQLIQPKKLYGALSHRFIEKTAPLFGFRKMLEPFEITKVN